LEGFEVRSHRVDFCKTQIKISNRRSKLNKQYSYSENESELGEESPWGEPYGLGVIESTSWALQKIPSDNPNKSNRNLTNQTGLEWTVTHHQAD
jgi:hypothetical protein